MLVNVPSIPRHPAPFNPALLPVFARHLKGCERILDPFGGKGGIFDLLAWLPDARIDAVEIEADWVAADRRITHGNALHLPWDDATFDAICTSPTYSNRMADHHEARDGSKRNTYRHYLGHPLHPDNSGQLQWGKKYRDFHVAAWSEALRVLKPGGTFILNCKDHVREGVMRSVTQWHVDLLCELGCDFLDWERVKCSGIRYGANSDKRAANEDVVVFRYKGVQTKSENAI